MAVFPRVAGVMLVAIVLVATMSAAVPLGPPQEGSGLAELAPADDVQWLALQTASGDGAFATLQWAEGTYRVLFDYSDYYSQVRDDGRLANDPDSVCYAPDDCPDRDRPDYYSVCCTRAAVIQSYLWTHYGEPLGCFTPEGGYVVAEAHSPMSGALALIPVESGGCGPFPDDPVEGTVGPGLHWWIHLSVNSITFQEDNVDGAQLLISLYGTVVSIVVSFIATPVAGILLEIALLAGGQAVSHFGAIGGDSKGTNTAFVSYGFDIPIAHLEMGAHWHTCESRDQGRDTWDFVEDFLSGVNGFYDRGPACFAVAAFGSPLGVSGTVEDPVDFVPHANAVFLNPLPGDGASNRHDVALIDIHTVGWDSRVEFTATSAQNPSWSLFDVGATWDYEWAQEVGTKIRPRVDSTSILEWEDTHAGGGGGETVEFWLSAVQGKACEPSHVTSSSEAGKVTGSSVVEMAIGEGCDVQGFSSDNPFRANGVARGVSEATRNTRTVTSQIHADFDLIPQNLCLAECLVPDAPFGIRVSPEGKLEDVVQRVKDVLQPRFPDSGLQVLVFHQPKSLSDGTGFDLFLYAENQGIQLIDAPADLEAWDEVPVPQSPVVSILVDSEAL